MKNTQNNIQHVNKKIFSYKQIETLSLTNYAL